MIVRPADAKPATIDDLIPPGLAAKLDRLDLLSRKIFAGKLPGERRSKRRGRSVEFDDFRNYAPGDDLRHIDWNVFARLDRLFIKLFREEEDLGVHLVVDASASMQAGYRAASAEHPAPSPGKLVFAHQVAMALAYIGLINQNRVSVSVFGLGASGGPRVRQLAPMRGRGSLVRVAAFLLECLDEAWGSPAQQQAGAAAADRFNEDVKRIAMTRSGRGVMAVMSDFLVPGGPGALQPAVNALAAAGSAAFDTYLLQTLAPAELDPASEAGEGLIGDLRLTDIESAEAREVTISAGLITAYKRCLAAYTAGLRDLAVSRGLGAFVVPTDTPIETLVLDSLRRGGMLR